MRDLCVKEGKENILSAFVEKNSAGRGLGITFENGRIRVVAESGSNFAIKMTKKEYLENNLLAGQEIFFHIPPEAIKIRTAS